MDVSTDLIAMSTHYFLDWETVWREVNIILALIAIACLAKNLILWRKFWTYQERSVVWGTIILTSLAVAESAFSAFKEREFGPMLPFLTVALLFLIAGSFHTPIRVAEFKALKHLTEEGLDAQ